MSAPINDLSRMLPGRCIVHLKSGEVIDWPASYRASLFDTLESGSVWCITQGTDGDIIVRMDAIAAIVTLPSPATEPRP